MRRLVPSALLLLALAGCGTPAPTTPATTAPGLAAGPAAPAAVDADTAAPVADAPDGPTAQDVVAAFAAAGLPVVRPRDNTAADCPALDCAQLVTTDSLSVVQFDDLDAAQRYAGSFGDDAHLEGPIVLQYAAARTPADQRSVYEARLQELLDQRN